MGWACGWYRICSAPWPAGGEGGESGAVQVQVQAQVQAQVTSQLRFEMEMEKGLATSNSSRPERVGRNRLELRRGTEPALEGGCQDFFDLLWGFDGLRTYLGLPGYLGTLGRYGRRTSPESPQVSSTQT